MTDKLDEIFKKYLQKRRSEEVLKAEGGWEDEKVDPALVRRAQSLMGGQKSASCPHCRKAITPFKRPLSAQKRENILWWAAAAVSFALSFAVPRYFMQFLAVALLAGFKAVVETRATKTQILIYKALEQDKSERLHEHSSRL